MAPSPPCSPRLICTLLSERHADAQVCLDREVGPRHARVLDDLHDTVVAEVVTDELLLPAVLVTESSADARREEPPVGQPPRPAEQDAPAVDVRVLLLLRHVPVVDAVAQAVEPAQRADLDRGTVQHPARI